MFFQAAHGSFETLVALGLSLCFGVVGCWLGRSRGNARLAGFAFAFVLGPFGILICLLTPRHPYVYRPMPDVDAAFERAKGRWWGVFRQLNYIVTFGHAVLWCVLSPPIPRDYRFPIEINEHGKTGAASGGETSLNREQLISEQGRQRAIVARRLIPSVPWFGTTPIGWYAALPVVSWVAREAMGGFPRTRRLLHAFLDLCSNCQ